MVQLIRNFIALFFIASSYFSYAQSFEGKLIYNHSYESKLPNVTSQQFDVMMGTTSEYYIKGAYYKSVMKGTVSELQVYSPTENRLYNKMSITDTLLWNDGSSSSDKVTDYSLAKSDLVILGYKCKVLEVPKLAPC